MLNKIEDDFAAATGKKETTIKSDTDMRQSQKDKTPKQHLKPDV